jgi:hypothetical protein
MNIGKLILGAEVVQRVKNKIEYVYFQAMCLEPNQFRN